MHHYKDVITLHAFSHKFLIRQVNRRIWIEDKEKLYLSSFQHLTQLGHVVCFFVSLFVSHRCSLAGKLFALKEAQVYFPVGITIMHPEPPYQGWQKSNSPYRLTSVKMFLDAKAQMYEAGP